MRDDRLEEFVDPTTMFRRHRIHRRDPHAPELTCQVFEAIPIDLVDREHDGSVRSTQEIRYVPIRSGIAGTTIDKKNDDIRLLDRHERLLPHGLKKIGVGIGLESARVNEESASLKQLAASARS